MPTVDENRLKGNYAEAYVAARLAAECLVRPVAAGTDVGVDLYCETVQGSQPFLHFWVQVKAGAQCRLSEDGSSATFSFDHDHLRYWWRQPVPVFVALVPVDWPVDREPDVHLIDVSGDLLRRHGAPDGPGSMALPSTLTWRAGDRGAVKQFLTDLVPAAAARLQVRHGMVAGTPSLVPRYETTVPHVPVSLFKEEILDQIRHTAAFGILNLRLDRALGRENSGFRRRLAKVLAAFEDDEHCETSEARAVSCHEDGQHEEAVNFYDRALASIHRDEKVRNKPEWRWRIMNLGMLRLLATDREEIS